jgi:hypothetical protein
MRITSFGAGTLSASLTAGVCRGDEPQEIHQLSVVIEACEVDAHSPGGDGPGDLAITPRLERVDARVSPPGVSLLVAFVFETPQGFRVW